MINFKNIGHHSFNLLEWKFLTALALSVFICSCGRKSDSPKKNLPEAQSVKTAQARLQPMERTITVSGSFFAREEATLSVKIPGRLQKISVDIGSVVKKGDLLAQIEPADYEIRLQQAEAALAQARARLGLPLEGDDDTVDLEKTGTVLQAKALLEEATQNRKRIKELAAEKIAAQSELERVEAEYLVAVSRYQDALEQIRERQALVAQRRAEMKFAKKQLADTSIKAPFDGTVQQRRASLGEILETGTPLLVIADVDPLRLRLEIPERESLQVRSGQTLRISVGQGTNTISSTINRVSPMLSASNRMLVAEADVPATPALRPGLFAQATIVLSKDDHVISIPESAVTSFVGIEKIFLVQDGKAQEKNIRTGRRSNGFVEIEDGIEAGDVVILNPGNLRSGQAIIEEADAETR